MFLTGLKRIFELERMRALTQSVWRPNETRGLADPPQKYMRKKYENFWKLFPICVYRV